MRLLSSITPPPPTGHKTELIVQIQDLSYREFKLNIAYSITTIPTPPRIYGRLCFRMEPQETFKVLPNTVFIKWGDMDHEDLTNIIGWIYEDAVTLPPLPVQRYGKGYNIMKAKGYDGTSGLGKNKTGRREPIEIFQTPKYLGLGFGSLNNDDQNTFRPSNERVHAFDSVETTRETLTETDSQEWEFGSERSLSDCCLDDLFFERGELTS
jgi:hypothetical protein